MSLSPRWPQTAIGDFAEVATGGTPSTAKSEYWESGTIPWLNSGELNKGLIYQSENFITQSGLNNSSAQMMPKETVLIALTGATTGVSALLKMEACANQSVTGVLPSPHHNPSFLLHFLRSIRPKILSDSYGGAQKHISQGYVKQLKVPLPPLTEQRRIAAILDQAEALRTKRRAALAKLDALAQSIFLEMFGDPITNPKNWPMVPMASMFAAPPNIWNHDSSFGGWW
jgi:restriction endonuclease S subunit